MTHSALALLLSVAPAQPVNTIDPAVLDRYRTEGRAAYRQYAAAVRSMEELADAEKSERPRAGGVATAQYKLEMRFVRSGDNTRVERTTVGPPAADEPYYSIECQNRVYEFRAVHQSSAHPLLLTRYGPTENYGRGPGIPRAVLDLFLLDFEKSLAAADGTPDVNILRAGRDADSGLIAVAHRDDRFGVGIERCLWFNPERHWRVERLTGSNRVLEFESSFAYGLTLAELDYPKEYMSVSTPRDGGPATEYRAVVRDVKPSHWGTEEFRLPAVGLPEPSDVRWAFWPGPTDVAMLAVGAAAIVAAGVWLVRRRKRRGPVAG